MEQKYKGLLLMSENKEIVSKEDNSNSSEGFSILHLIEQQALKNPDAIAVVQGENSLTYQELDSRSNQLAHFLKAQGVKENGMYAILMERSLEMILGILGILKAGGAYVPIDPQHPQQRIGFILKETQADLMLCHNQTRTTASGLPMTSILVWEDIQAEVHAQPVENPLIRPEPNHLAYVIFTSGSTGKPKGVMIEHAQLFYSTLARIQYYPPFSSLLLVPSFAFDASVGAIFGCLCQGDCLILSSQKALQDPLQLRPLLAWTGAVLCVPSYYKFLLDEDLISQSGISTVIVGGETLTPELVAQHFGSTKNISLFNEYGPTETTVWATVNKVEPNKSTISIGTAITGTEIYVLDEQGDLLPEGAVGELYISGPGVARGYLNDKKLTKEKFLHNPFDADQAARMYKTGDLGYWLPDRGIAYVGRLDDQIKINGQRVEPGEIESVLVKYHSVKQAVVIAKDLKNGEKQLVTFVVPEGEFDAQDIKRQLKDELPVHLIPHIWVALESFPLTPQGKTDRKALRMLDLGEHGNRQYEGPRNFDEERVVTIWERLLRKEGIGIHDDFFELGGNSLLAMKFLAQARRELRIHASVRDLFDFPTLAMFLNRFNSTKGISDALSLKAVLPKPARVPTSFNQESLWIIDRISGTIPYHLPLVIKVDGEVDSTALNQSLTQLIIRHEPLRTVIREDDDLKFQHILDAENWQMSIIDAAHLKDDEPLFQRKIEELILQPFDLSADFMVRATLMRLSDKEHVLLVVLHHIAFDAWSKTVFLKELLSYYNAFKQKTKASIAPLTIQYSDYALWQKARFEQHIEGKSLAYWKNKLKGLAPLQLPQDLPDTADKPSSGAAVHFLLQPDLVKTLERLTGKENATLFMVLLAGFKLLLYRYSSQEDLCVGTAVAGRQEPETEDLIGYFINTVALRTQVTGKASFVELLTNIKDTVLEAFDHQEVPFEKVVSEIGADRTSNRHPLFQVMFLLQNTPEIPPLRLDGADLTILPEPHHTSKFDLTLSLTESPEGLRGTVEYRTDRFDAGTIEKMTGHYQEILRSAVQDPTEKVGKINMLSLKERQQLLYTFNNTAVKYPGNKTLVDLIEEQVKQTPDGLALTFEGHRLSYQELNQRSNRLAHLLKEKGVAEETLVLVCIERSLEMVVAILGVLKAGAAYVPIDPEYPEERIRFIQEDTGARLAVGTKKSFVKLSSLNHLDLVDLEEQTLSDQNLSIEDLRIPIRPHHLAYVIYTSGSTGKPKGVMIEHSNAYSFICWCREEFANSRFDTVYSGTSICFDLSVFELFYPLSVGKSVRILQNGLEISQTIPTDSNVLINTVPSVIDHLVKEGVDLSNANVINMAGEAVSEKLLMALDTHGKEVRNLYGPSEDTTYSTCHLIGNDRKPLIGRPISNTRIYIVTAEYGLNPVGIPGEICIGGSGLARGYLNRPELTANAFVADPFLETNERMYRTGDVGRWRADGKIEFLGRKDDQVKIRGFRIELGEIERVLNFYQGVLQAVVLAKPDKQGNNQLVGYVVYEGQFRRKSVMDFLKQKLPAYMVPNLWVTLDKMPLTQNGKINKKALPNPEEQEDRQTGYVAPRNNTEKRIAEIWQKLLKLEHVGIYDDFFQSGGDSLLAIRFVSELNKELGLELRIKDLFDYPTIDELTTRLDFKPKLSNPAPVTLSQQRPPSIPLSYNQESLWFIDRLTGSSHYHIPLVLNIIGTLDEAALAKALKNIIERHEVLRTVIKDSDGVPFQVIMSSDHWTMPIIRETPDKVKKVISQTVSKPFNLSQDYLFRATLVHLGQQNHTLVIVMHHIAADGWSVSLLIDEISALYMAYQEGVPATLSPLPFQYADFALWQRKQLEGSLLDKGIHYWKQKLKDLSPLELPADYPSPAVQSIKGGVRTFSIQKDLADRIAALAQKQGATLFMTLLAAFKLLLFKKTSQQDLCVGTANAGRQLRETEKLIGYFINPLPIRSTLSATTSFNEFLQEVKASSLEAFDHQEVPFEKILAAVGSARNVGKNPLFQVMFILQNFPELHNLQLGPVQISQEPLSQTTSKFDLTLTISPTPEGLSGSMEFSSDLFKSKTIDRMISEFIRLLDVVASEPDKKIGLLVLTEKPDQQQNPPKPLASKGRKRITDGREAAQSRSLAKTPQESLISRIWENALSIKNIDLSDNFFEIGGHSLIAVQVMTHLEKELGTKLPLSILFEFPTIKQLARAVESKHKRKSKWKSLVAIKSTGSKLPLYIIPGSGASLLPFYAIAKNLAADQPLFGLQPKGLNGDEPPLASVVAIASHFVAEILKHNPQGPYSLAGYSFGGIIAYEMAQQLQKAGKEVRHLIMFDTIAYQEDPGESWLRKLGNKIKFSVGKRKFDVFLLIKYPRHFGRLKKESFRKKFSNLKKLLGWKKAESEAPILSAIKNLEAIHMEASKSYIIKPYPGEIHLLKARIPTYYIPEPVYLGWQPYVKRVHVREMEGEHTTMFAPPYDAGFAQALQEILNN